VTLSPFVRLVLIDPILNYVFKTTKAPSGG
jgi:hypothetical protein